LIGRAEAVRKKFILFLALGSSFSILLLQVDPKRQVEQTCGSLGCFFILTLLAGAGKFMTP
jgi:hypothetical protein